MSRSLEVIREENIKTVFDFEKWIKEKTNYSDKKINLSIFNNIVDNLIEQIRQTGKDGSADFIVQLKKLKERKSNEE